MNWEGFLRSLASDIWAGVGFLWIVGMIYFILRAVVNRRGYINNDVKSFMSTVRVIVVTLVVFTVLTLFGRAASVAFANRMPRQDVDKNPVYEQMDSHGQGR